MKTYIINRDGDSKDDRNKGAGLRITVPVLLFWLAVWQAAAMIVHKPLLLPDPGKRRRRWLQWQVKRSFISI